MRSPLKIGMLLFALVLLAEVWVLHTLNRSPAQWHASMVVKEQPTARARYETMRQTLAQLRSLSYRSLCSGPDRRATHYQVQYRGLGHFRIKVGNVMTGKTTTCVYDGNDLWIHWPGTRAYWAIDKHGNHETNKEKVFIRTSMRTAENSVKTVINHLGMAWYSLILDPSQRFQLPTERHSKIDGIRLRGTDRIRGEPCDVIEISYNRAETTQYIWISCADHLPRRIKEIVRPENNRVTVEEWSKIKQNPPLLPQHFTWSPPANWTPWEPNPLLP
ncbi:hypothetical protein ACFL6U_02735 [Planctomycetota bacterium]